MSIDGTMTITPLPGGTGVEVTGVDLRRPVDEGTRAALNKALLDHVAVVVRDQDFTPDEYVRAVEVFGEPMSQQYADRFALKEKPIVQVVSSKHKKPDGSRVLHGRIWHSDHTHHAEPPKCTVLYGVEVPEKGGATNIANMRKAYESLPAEERAKLDRLRVVTAVGEGRAALAASTKDDHVDKGEASPLGVTHPLIREHPENGSKAIYFHAIKTDHIEGMTPEETKALLLDLLERTTTEAFVYSHVWRKGDLLIWDNRSALHQASFDYPPDASRELYRLILRGDAPYGPAMPKDAPRAVA